MPKQTNPFASYVEERLHILAINQEEETREATKQSVTVRLNPPLIRLMDGLAEKLGHSRQAMLLEIIATSLHDIATAYADTHGDKAQEVYRELMDLKQFQEGDLK